MAAIDPEEGAVNWYQTSIRGMVLSWQLGRFKEEVALSVLPEIRLPKVKVVASIQSSLLGAQSRLNATWESKLNCGSALNQLLLLKVIAS